MGLIVILSVAAESGAGTAVDPDQELHFYIAGGNPSRREYAASLARDLIEAVGASLTALSAASTEASKVNGCGFTLTGSGGGGTHNSCGSQPLPSGANGVAGMMPPSFNPAFSVGYPGGYLQPPPSQPQGSVSYLANSASAVGMPYFAMSTPQMQLNQLRAGQPPPFQQLTHAMPIPQQYNGYAVQNQYQQPNMQIQAPMMVHVGPMHGNGAAMAQTPQGVVSHAGGFEIRESLGNSSLGSQADPDLDTPDEMDRRRTNRQGTTDSNGAAGVGTGLL